MFSKCDYYIVIRFSKRLKVNSNLTYKIESGRKSFLVHNFQNFFFYEIESMNVFPGMYTYGNYKTQVIYIQKSYQSEVVE